MRGVDAASSECVPDASVWRTFQVLVSVSPFQDTWIMVLSAFVRDTEVTLATTSGGEDGRPVLDISQLANDAGRERNHVKHP